MKTSDLFFSLLTFLILIALVTGAMMAAVFGFLYLTADDVECGTYGPIPYCTGTYHIETNLYENSSTTCHKNGEEVNCSEIQWDPGIDNTEAIPE